MKFIVCGGLTAALAVAAIMFYMSKQPVIKSPFYKESGAAMGFDSYIAHAGGQINGAVYTNSREAMERSAAFGYKFIEIDFQISTDGHLVGVHNWDEFHNRTGHPGQTGPISLEEFLSRQIDGLYTPVDAESVCRFLQQYPDIMLVTDKIKDFRLLLKEIPFNNRMIVETLSMNAYDRAVKAGIRYPALEASPPERLAKVTRYKISIVTVSADVLMGNPDAYKRLYNDNVTIMMYTTSDKDVMGKYFTAPVSMYYTEL